MALPNEICRLYDNVLKEDIQKFRITNADIRTGIQNMKEVYKPDPTSLTSQILDVADYNDVAHRCAYLHKYAPLHTALVSDMLVSSLELQTVRRVFEDILSKNGRINVCSLGGGPGNDIIAIIAALSSVFGFFQMSATIIDCMDKWRFTFNSLIKELSQGSYGVMSDFVQPQYFNWNYIEHNLIGKMTNNVNKAVQGAHLITMVKFVSAAACKDTPVMIKKIFRSLKAGALVLYIDNAGGGFHQLISSCARECKMTSVFGPLKHYKYSNSNYNVVKFGYTPCLETTVTIHILRKSIYDTYDNQSLTLNAEYLEDASVTRVVNANTNNTYTQYNIVNQNYLMANSNNYNISRNHSQNRNSNRGRSTSGNRSSSKNRSRSRNRRAPRNPVQAQPQYRQMNNTSNEQSDSESNEGDCSCCVIS